MGGVEIATLVIVVLPLARYVVENLVSCCKYGRNTSDLREARMQRLDDNIQKILQNQSPPRNVELVV